MWCDNKNHEKMPQNFIRKRGSFLCKFSLFPSSECLKKMKNYLQKQWSKIKNGHLNLRNFTIAKEVFQFFCKKINKEIKWKVKVGSYASESSLPPSALIAQKMQEKDPMAYPKYGERVKYLVVNGNIFENICQTI